MNQDDRCARPLGASMGSVGFGAARRARPCIPINNETKELRCPPRPIWSRHRAPDAPAAIFTSDNEPPADIYIFNSINPQSPGRLAHGNVFLSFPRPFLLLSSLSSSSSSPSPPPPGLQAVRHQQPHRRRHLLALIDRKGSLPPSRTLFRFSLFHLSIPLARAGSHFCPKRNFIRLRQGKETKRSRRRRRKRKKGVRYDGARK